MAGISGRQVAFNATVYFVASKIETKSIANVEAGAIVGNKIIDIAEIGALNKSRAVIDVPVYGEDFASKLVGQASAADFNFNVTLNMDNSVHQAIRDDDGKTEHTFIIKYELGAAATYAVFDGYVSGNDVTSPLDNRQAMDVTVARTGGVTWVDKA
jgi:hypothetical protein